MESNTTMGGPPGHFPTTRWSMIRDCTDPAASTFRDSLDRLAATYWRPIYAYFRKKWNKSKIVPPPRATSEFGGYVTRTPGAGPPGPFTGLGRSSSSLRLIRGAFFPSAGFP